MTCRALLHKDGSESIPLLLVRRGELTPRQCDHEFAGMTGDCPTCKAQSEAADMESGGTYAAGILLMRQRGFSVGYKRFGYGSTGNVEPWRVCYWGHPPGYWKDVPFRNCQNADTDTHTIALRIIREHYARQFKPDLGFTIKTEPRLRRPGDPPRPYSPDLAIYGPNNERMVAVEYQRSYEPYDRFVDRDSLRRSEGWAAVDWWYDDTQADPSNPRRTVYDKSQEHRTHLALLGVRLYRCWVDPDTLKLQAEPGRSGELPPKRHKRIERHLERSALRECSTAKLIQQLESTPEEVLIKDYKQPLRPSIGSSLNFLDDLSYSIERERRVAQAIVAQQKRLEEQDRRHREYESKRVVISQIRDLIYEFAVLDLDTSASCSWSIDRLEAELARIQSHRSQAEKIWQQQQQELAAKLREQEAARLQAQADADRQRQQQLDDHLRVQEQARAEAYRRWEIENAYRAEQERKRREYEAKWNPIEARDETVRGHEILRTLVMPGDFIRRRPGSPIERYTGVSGAGYSTDRHTYASLVGWQIWKGQGRP